MPSGTRSTRTMAKGTRTTPHQDRIIRALLSSNVPLVVTWRIATGKAFLTETPM